jgi:hypothetical protein
MAKKEEARRAIIEESGGGKLSPAARKNLAQKPKKPKQIAK